MFFLIEQSVVNTSTPSLPLPPPNFLMQFVNNPFVRNGSLQVILLLFSIGDQGDDSHSNTDEILPVNNENSQPILEIFKKSDSNVNVECLSPDRNSLNEQFPSNSNDDIAIEPSKLPLTYQTASSIDYIIPPSDSDDDIAIEPVESPHTPQVTSNIDYFIPPSDIDKQDFYNYHPKQDTDKINKEIFSCKNGVKRKWLSYNDNQHALYCSMCLGFSQSESTFVTGMKDIRHMFTRVNEHEMSASHRNAVSSYITWVNRGIEHSLDNQKLARKKFVLEKRDVLCRVIDIVRVIGKTGISYRSHANEEAYTLNDNSAKHGNFLELVLLLGKYDSTLNTHVQECVRKSIYLKEKSKKKSGRRGRGNFVTFLTKNTVNLILDIFKKFVQSKISSQIEKAGMFSIQLDTTQDVSTKDQCSIVLRYLDPSLNSVKERLTSVIEAEASSGEYFLTLIKKCLSELEIDIINCISDSTDGAANMQGMYKGFSAMLSAELRTHIHTWCYAHVLNLIISDATSGVIQTITLFSLLNNVANFVKESYKRMKLWKTHTEGSRRLVAIGETRWWSKGRALERIFGSFETPGDCLFVNIIIMLLAVKNDKTMKPQVRQVAGTYMDNLLKYETILTSQLFLRIFSYTTVLSKYLQTNGLDLLTANRLMKEALIQIRSIIRDFNQVHVATEKFVSWYQHEIQQHEVDQDDVKIEDELPRKRSSSEDPLFRYECNVHNVVLDQTVASFECRFNEKTREVIQDLSLLDPRSFPDIMSKGVPPNAMEKLSHAVQNFDSSITPSILRDEISDLARNWGIIKKCRLADYSDILNLRDNLSSDDSEDEEEHIIENISKDPKAHIERCRNCPGCVFLLLSDYNMLCNSYSHIAICYKYLLTISVTQVACERSFSLLKLIKTRIRSTMCQDRLESFMLMTANYDIVESISNDEIIDKIARHSSAYSKILLE